MKRYSYDERDYDFGQLIQTLRSNIGLSQAGLGELLGVSRRAVAEWEGGLSYPKAERLKHLIELGVQQQAFAAGREEEEIRTLWKAAHQKVLLDEAWLRNLFAPPAPVQISPQVRTTAAHAAAGPAASPRVNLVEALDVSHFTGREVEVAELTQWIVQERCRLVVLLGMGGIGKSTLASYLGQHLAPHFEAVLWRSVRDAPSCEELVADCITFFSETPPTSFPTSLEQRITQLLVSLQASRCLLVLDNLESLLQSGDQAGGYLPGYEGYGRLIQRLGESAHQSCVLLTSREKPKEIEPLEGTRSPVRSLHLVGLDEQAAKALLSDKGLSGTPAAWQRLVASYAGNPLALKIVAQAVSDLFGGDLDRFLQEGELVFNGVRPVLRQQVGRLTPLEHLLLTWLAVLREWTPLDSLMQVLHPRVLRARVLEALEALGRRSLLERGQQASFGLQSVVMEFLTDELGERLAEEIVLGTPQQLRSYALEQAQAKDYARETQVRLLVHPLIERLRAELGTDSLVEEHLLGLLAQFRGEDAPTQGYGPANVISLLKALRGHLRGLDLSQLISGSQEGVIHIRDLRTGTLLSRLHTQGGRILTLAWSADGHLLASGGQDAVIRLWDAEQWTLLRELAGHRDWVCALAFAPGPQTSLLASGSFDQAIKLWDVATGDCRSTLEGHLNWVGGLAWSPDSRTLASAGFDTTIRLWDAQTGQCRHILQGHRDAVTSVAFLPTGDRLLSGSYDRTLRLWDVQSGQNLRTVQGYALELYALAWSPDGRSLVSGSSEATLTLWNMTTRTPVRVLRGHRQRVNVVAWSRAANRIASGSVDHTVRLWDAQTGVCTHILQGHTASVSSVDWSADGNLLVSGGVDGRVCIWDVQQGDSRVGIEQAGWINAVAWSPDGTLVASSSEERLMLVWRAADGGLLQRFEHAGAVSTLCWSPGGEQLVSGSADGERGVLSIWDVRQGALVRKLEGHSGYIMGVEWSPQDNLLVSAGNRGTVRWWDPQQGVQLAMVQAHERWARAVRVSPDGNTVASCGEDGVIKLWDMHSHQLLATLRADRPYERLDISHTSGLTNAQQAALRALGAVGAENDRPPLM